MNPLARSPLFALLAAALAVGCGSPPAPPSDAADAQTADASLDAARDASLPDASESPSDLVALAIEPAEATVTVVNGVSSPVAFRATGRRRDGAPAAGLVFSWTQAGDRVGTLSSMGEFSANNVSGGVAEIAVEAPGPRGAVLRATARVTVNVRWEALAAGAPADAPTRFAESPTVADSARAPRLLYPLDNAVMPNNVAPPHVQWENGAAGDLYRVRISKAHLEATFFVLHTGAAFRFDYPIGRDAWRSVAESDVGAVATIALDRYDAVAREVVAGSTARVRLTPEGISGAVYYFTFLGASVASEMRIDPLTAERTNIIPNPPPTPTRGDRCLGCHTVSRDGRYLATAMGGDVASSGVFDLTTDLRSDPPPTAYPPARIGGRFFFAFNPDATRLMAADARGALELFNPRDGASVAATGLPTLRGTHPEWAPDDSGVVYVDAADLAGDVFQTGDITFLPRTGADAFGPSRLLHRGSALSAAPEGGNADSHPTYSPDGRYVVFQHGPDSYSGTSRVSLNDVRALPGALYALPRDGGTPVRLDNAIGGPASTVGYWPTFSPFITGRTGMGRYYWLAFDSRRDYGNTQAGTRGTERLQLWVTAIDLDAAPGTDPSSVPYWLPGQDSGSGNLGAYWAPAACRVNSAECLTSAECCSGQCLPDPGTPGRFVCRPPPPSECRREGQTCGGNGDCCMGLTCFANVCGAPPG